MYLLDFLLKIMTIKNDIDNNHNKVSDFAYPIFNGFCSDN